ncbi:uncharacterized protein DUF3667 [Chitinophaga niastensis]|uniref:Uncharacterized protein DUF3667 n=1 Tax=Chitinophaga niastensis TaxID=536980 RepID=A0A2P8HP97_CHINA|nr:DUF3667 domain-containing protein [Chitinophaga niastensis]PSL48043.1 uncharacterized protein DUF3667 [Chitinophaga niastensis]
MKTQPLRKEKQCLNCGTEVPERYCTHCGQENTVPHETFGHLVKHFVADIFHYDSQFLTTLKYLLFRPGFLTKEYMAGKRVRYVNPIKLYVFVSFVFFFGLFTLQHEDGYEGPVIKTQVMGDSVKVFSGPESVQNALKNDTSKSGRRMVRAFDEMKGYKTVAEYDAALAKLSPQERPELGERIMTRRMIELRRKYGNDQQKAIIEMFKHNVPKIMFLLLPLFALFMKWMYRRKKQWLYADHAIFAIHFHAFAFILALVGIIFEYFLNWEWVMNTASWVIFGYLVLGLRNIYQQSFGKSLLKAGILTFTYATAAVFVFIIFLGLIFGLFL